MASQRGDIPAIESDTSSGLFGMGITRRNVSYDDLMDAAMHSPPPDFTINMLWKNPLIPQHKFRNTAEEGESGGKSLTFEAAPVKSQVPVVKAKATSLMSSFMTKQTQENLQQFEHQAGLADARYSPHKGLSTEECRFHRLGDCTVPWLQSRINTDCSFR